MSTTVHDYPPSRFTYMRTKKVLKMCEFEIALYDQPFKRHILIKDQELAYNFHRKKSRDFRSPKKNLTYIPTLVKDLSFYFLSIFQTLEF